MAIETKQSFLKGINRRFDREESVDPDFFYSTQNARLYTRGETGKVQRINGFTEFISTGTDYSNTLDVIDFKGYYVVLYEDTASAGTFHVEVFDGDGTQQYEEEYDGEQIDQGSLVKTDESVFISPHNKILFYNGGSWSLEDFVSNVPSISDEGITEGGGEAEGVITVEGTPSTATRGAKASGQITVKKNNTVAGQSDSFSITIGSNTTDSIAINYQMSERDIAQEIYYALRGESGYDDPTPNLITDDYDVSLAQNQLNTFKSDSQTVYLTTNDETDTHNGEAITINDASYIITKELSWREYYERSGINPPEGGTGSNAPGAGSGFFDDIESTVSTITTSVPKGGVSTGGSFIGPLFIRFNNIQHTVKTENIVSTDSIDDIVNKIDAALLADPKFVDSGGTPTNELFSVDADTVGNTVTITARQAGEKFNGEISLRFNIDGWIPASDIFDLTITDFTGGIEIDPNLALDKDTNYWYKGRYKYIDGHVSQSCFPARVNTESSGVVSLTFDTPDLDLDGNRPKLQIFRRREGEEFFLIDEIDITGTTQDYTDDGEIEKSIFSEDPYIWTKNHKAQTILDDRYFKANLIYNEEEYTEIGENDFTLGTDTTDGEESLPDNTKARFYVQPQYIDGTKGYFQEIGVLDIKSGDKIATIDQSTPLVNSDKTIDELGIFVNYKPHAQEHIFRFNTIELANPNIPTIADSSFFPSTTRIFFGFKYLEVWEPANYSGVFKVAGWDSVGGARQHGGFVFDRFASSLFSEDFPRTLTIEMFGIPFKYVRHGYRDAGAEGETGVYKLDNFESIKKAVSTGNLILRLTGSNIGTLSSTIPDGDIFNEKVKVKSLIDMSAQYPDLDILSEDSDVMIGPLDSRLYLEMEESVLDEIDNTNVTKYSFSRNYEHLDFGDFFDGKFTGFPKESQDLSNATLSFEFTNYKLNDDASFNSYDDEGSANDGGRPESTSYGVTVYRYDWDYAKYELTSISFFDEDIVIFLGRKENEDNEGTPVSFPVTGLEYHDEDSLIYTTLLPSNIYATPFFKDSLNIDKTDYSNQIIWSNKLRQETGFTGGRTFRLESFFNIGSENGEILHIESLGNNLYAFCETGVAIINVGDVLTTQKQGEVFVDSSRVVTNYYWINDNLIDIKRKSIAKYKNVIYFSDGHDVYALTGEGIQNITQGNLPLNPDREYYGAINPKYSEYQLCDYSQTETWVYNLEFGQWYGPFTYVFTDAANIKYQFITVDDSLYEHDIGNTFDGTTYTTLLQSAGNDTDVSFYDKNFRKFYIQATNDSGATFKYGKDTSSLESVSFSSFKSRNGYYHQGIIPAEANAKAIFWEIETTDNNFELNDLSWRFNIRRRR